MEVAQLTRDRSNAFPCAVHKERVVPCQTPDSADVSDVFGGDNRPSCPRGACRPGGDSAALFAQFARDAIPAFETIVEFPHRLAEPAQDHLDCQYVALLMLSLIHISEPT